jgi:hypothetical protein
MEIINYYFVMNFFLSLAFFSLKNKLKFFFFLFLNQIGTQELYVFCCLKKFIQKKKK